MTIRISLSPMECEVAALIGCRRQLNAIFRKLEDRHGFDGDPWEAHIEGAAGEMAVAKALGVYWHFGVMEFKQPDVAGLQVRRRSKHYYDLLVRPDDKDDEKFVLVTGSMPDFRVHGWRWGRDAKQEEFLQRYGGRPPAWFVPQSELNPIEELRVNHGLQAA